MLIEMGEMKTNPGKCGVPKVPGINILSFPQAKRSLSRLVRDHGNPSYRKIPDKPE